MSCAMSMNDSMISPIFNLNLLPSIIQITIRADSAITQIDAEFHR